MSQYMILIYEDEASYATATPEVMGEVMEAHNAFAALNALVIVLARDVTSRWERDEDPATAVPDLLRGARP